MLGNIGSSGKKIFVHEKIDLPKGGMFMEPKSNVQIDTDSQIIDLTPENIADYGVCGYKDVKKHWN